MADSSLVSPRIEYSLGCGNLTMNVEIFDVLNIAKTSKCKVFKRLGCNNSEFFVKSLGIFMLLTWTKDRTHYYCRYIGCWIGFEYFRQRHWRFRQSPNRRNFTSYRTIRFTRESDRKACLWPKKISGPTTSSFISKTTNTMPERP